MNDDLKKLQFWLWVLAIELLILGGAVIALAVKTLLHW